MKYHAFRTVTKNGNSYAVVLPRLVLRRLHLLKGDGVELIFDDVEETLTLRSTRRPGRDNDGVQQKLDMVPVG